MKIKLFLSLLASSLLTIAQAGEWPCLEELCADDPPFRQTRGDLLIQQYIARHEAIHFSELNGVQIESGARLLSSGRLGFFYKDSGELIEVRSSLGRGGFLYVSAIVLFLDDPKSDQDIRAVISSSMSLGKYLKDGWSVDLGVVKNLFGIEIRSSSLDLDPDGMVLVLRRKY